MGPLKWNLEVFGTQRWGKPTDGAQTVDEKNGIKMFKDGKNHLYFQNYGYYNARHGSFVYFLMTAKN